MLDRMQLVLIRHGESVANRDGIIQGHFDAPLSPAGLAQADALADALATQTFDAIYCSDLARAHETGRRIAARLGLPLTLEPRLREIDVGLFTGQSWAQIEAAHPEAYGRFRASSDWADVPGAETVPTTFARLQELLAVVGDRRIAFVAHGAVLRRLLHLLLGLPMPSGIFFELHNASYSEVHRTGRGTTLLYLNRLPDAPVAQATTRSLI